MKYKSIIISTLILSSSLFGNKILPKIFDGDINKIEDITKIDKRIVSQALGGVKEESEVIRDGVGLFVYGNNNSKNIVDNEIYNDLLEKYIESNSGSDFDTWLTDYYNNVNDDEKTKIDKLITNSIFPKLDLDNNPISNNSGNIEIVFDATCGKGSVYNYSPYFCNYTEIDGLDNLNSYEIKIVQLPQYGKIYGYPLDTNGNLHEISLNEILSTDSNILMIYYDADKLDQNITDSFKFEYNGQVFTSNIDIVSGFDEEDILIYGVKDFSVENSGDNFINLTGWSILYNGGNKRNHDNDYYSASDSEIKVKFQNIGNGRLVMLDGTEIVENQVYTFDQLRDNLQYIFNDGVTDNQSVDVYVNVPFINDDRYVYSGTLYLRPNFNEQVSVTTNSLNIDTGYYENLTNMYIDFDNLFSIIDSENDPVYFKITSIDPTLSIVDINGNELSLNQEYPYDFASYQIISRDLDSKTSNITIEVRDDKHSNYITQSGTITFDDINGIDTLANNATFDMYNIRDQYDSVITTDQISVKYKSFILNSGITDNPNNYIFRLSQLPIHGKFYLNGVEMLLNDTFTQQDIIDGKLEYIPSDWDVSDNIYIDYKSDMNSNWPDKVQFTIYNEDVH